MKKFNITLLLLFLELGCFHGHAIIKREANEVDVYKVRENTDTIEIINPKATKPTLREIIYYHVIEKPYPEKHKPIKEENNFKNHFKDVTRPFTNGHGFQYLNEYNHDEEDSNEYIQPTNHELEPELEMNDKNEPKIPIDDETGLDDLKRPDEMHPDEINDSIKDEIVNEMEPNKEILNDKEDKPIRQKIEAMRRQKREIDYSELPPAPPLPAFRMDILPDYIKKILPTENEPTLTLKTPSFSPRSTEKPVLTRITERPERSRTTESDVPSIPIRIGDDEELKHKIIKKSPKNVDEDIEKEIREVIQKVTDGGNRRTDNEPASFGMELIGNSGMVWNDLNHQHYQYNVGPDANNEEVHNEQVPIKPETHNEEDKDINSEIESTLNEIEHILEEIEPLINNNSPEHNNLNEGTTESNDIEIINNNNNHEVNPENTQTDKAFDKTEAKSITKDEFIPKIDPRSPLRDSNDKNEAKPAINHENSIDLETALNILEVLQDIVANANPSDSKNVSNKDDTKDEQEKLTDEPQTKRKHHNHKGEGDKNNDSCKQNEIDDLLNNDKYWQWLKDSSEATLDLLMKRVLGLIKEETAKQIQALVTKMMAEQGYQPPETKEPAKQDDVETKPTGENDDTKISRDEKDKVDVMGEETDVNPQVLVKLRKNDKWKWLTDSFEAYLGTRMKRINQLIKEEVTRQIEHLVKYHMPKPDQSESSNNNNNEQNTKETVTANPEKDESKDNKDTEPNKDLNSTKDKEDDSKTVEESNKNNDVTTEVTKTESKEETKYSNTEDEMRNDKESNDETKQNSSTEDKKSEAKELNDDKDSNKGDENDDVKSES